ncbi:MAG: secretin N-terminal domain-containing protein [Novipirellula sp. JB048]
MASSASAQPGIEKPAGGAGPAMLKLTAQGEIPLGDLIEDLASRIDMRVVFDADIANRKINLVAPDPIPIAGLGELLQTLLVNEGLVITEPDERGIRRISVGQQMPRVARPSLPDESLGDVEAAVPLVRLFVLGDSRADRVSSLISPFLSPVGATAIPLTRSGMLVITDVAGNMIRIEKLLKLLDGTEAQIEIEFLIVKHVPAADLATQLQTILQSRQRARGGAISGGSPQGGPPPSGGGVSSGGEATAEITVDTRTNRLILIGTPAEITQIRSLASRLDEPLPTQQRSFELRFISPATLDDAVRKAIDGRSPTPPYQSRIENKTLVVDSTPEVLDLAARTRVELDTRVASDAQSPIRFYQIRNVPASELAETIRGVGAQVTLSNRPGLSPRRRTSNDAAVPGPNAFVDGAERIEAFGPVRNPLLPPAVVDPRRRGDAEVQVNVDAGAEERRVGEDFQRGVPRQLGAVPIGPGGPNASAGGPLSQAEIAVDVHTNTIIVVAPPDVQRIYANLIDRLDQRRPQVLIEARVVVIDTSDNYTVGVEVGGGDRSGAGRLFAFSSYGLSTVDPVEGSLQILPGTGLNATLVDPRTADAVVRSLANHRRARVLSTPRVLVNDNAEGQLTSVLEVPFTSVNASQTVATTSFAGFAEAGTTIQVTPTISEDDYLQLDYVVTLNSFTGVSAEGVPPPRQTNEVRSRVTVPDGYTVIVGGLTSKNIAYEIDSIPFLEQIPVIKDLVSLQTDSRSETSLFVFLKPVILRDDQFKDLRFLSDVAEMKSASEPVLPVIPPLLMK